MGSLFDVLLINNQLIIAKTDIVIDVGGEYEPAIERFDLLGG